MFRERLPVEAVRFARKAAIIPQEFSCNDGESSSLPYGADPSWVRRRGFVGNLIGKGETGVHCHRYMKFRLSSL